MPHHPTTLQRSSGIAQFFISLVIGLVVSIHSEELNAAARSDLILQTVDTSSPRATLNGFMAVMNERYQTTMDPNSLIQTYLRSGRLFPERFDMKDAIATVERDRAISAKFLDLREVPLAIQQQSAWRLTLQLMEIFNHIPMPSLVDVPDAAAMEGLSMKKWTVPGTEIRIALVESGPRAGEYLFTKETVAQIPIFFERIRTIDYPASTPPFIFDTVFNLPTGLATYLAYVVPPRWFMTIPAQLTHTIFGEPIWRWVALLILLFLMGWVLWISVRLALRASSLGGVMSILMRISPAITLVLLVPLLCFVLGDVFRVTPYLFGRLTLVFWGMFYLALTWMVWGFGEMIAEWIIGLERIQTDSTDSQLIRLTARLIAMGFGIGILIEGADRIGLPSYSIMAGLGVGGLAVALAGQQALSNLLGSLIIMFEKPFRIGHTIKTGGIEGTIENIGFRTAKIRTSDGILLIAPSSELIRHPIENMTMRDSWRIKKTLHFSIESAIEDIQAFKKDAAAFIANDIDVIDLTPHVALVDIGIHGYEVLIDFALGTSQYEKQLTASDRILGGLASLAEQSHLCFRQARD